MLEQATFNLMLACFVAHELDAVDKREWRLIFILRTMADNHAGALFTLLHIPLAFVTLSLVFSASPDVAYYSRLLLDVFAMIHLYLHWRLRNHPENRFVWPGSYVPIASAGILGGIHACYTAIASSTVG